MPKASPLTGQHEAAGASFVEQEGWTLPLHFGDPLGEYRSVRSRVGLLDLSHRTLLSFSGVDRLSFLQGMVSNDVKALGPGDGAHAAVLDVQGKILADVRIFCAGDFFLLDLWEPLKEKILAHLNRYLIADDVEIADLTGRYGLLSLQGPKAHALLTEFLGQPELPLKDLGHRFFSIGNAEARVIRATHTGEEGYDIWVGAHDLLSAAALIRGRGGSLSPPWVGAQAQEILRIEAGIPRYGVDMSEDNLLLEIGLERAVSFQKGCYLGQEVVERIRSRGHVNKRLVGLVLEGDRAALPGDTIRAAEKETGKVTSSVVSPARRRPLALGYVHRDYLQPGTAVTIQSATETIPGTVSSLPFYKTTP